MIFIIIWGILGLLSIYLIESIYELSAYLDKDIKKLISYLMIGLLGPIGCLIVIGDYIFGDYIFGDS
jgi:hypothetical protein